MPLLHEVAHLGHVELLTPEPDKSLWFFTEVLGLTPNGASGNSVFLRTWDDYEHHSLKLTASASSGIGRTGLRAASPDALQHRVAAIEAAGHGIGWQDAADGIGPAYLFRDPDGHEIELYWETERYEPPPELRPALKNQAQAYPGRGVSVRRLDHVNYLAAQAEPNGRFVCSALGGRVTEQIMLDDGTISAQWLHFAQKSYDLVYTSDWTGANGRLHHLKPHPMPGFSIPATWMPMRLSPRPWHSSSARAFDPQGHKSPPADRRLPAAIANGRVVRASVF